MEKYTNMIKRFFNFSLDGSTTRAACLVLIGIGALHVITGDILGGVATWAVGAALWGIRDKQDD